MNVLQGNLHRSRVAHNLLSQLVLELKIDLLLLSEQYRDRQGSRWYEDTLGTAAIWVPNTNILIRGHGAGRGYVWVECSQVTFVSCYFTPNSSAAEFQDNLNQMEDTLRTLGKVIIVGGDFNARSVEWGMQSTDSRGRRILEMAARIGLEVANLGNTPTFRRPGYQQTIPDITFATGNLMRDVQRWRVLEDFTGSDHQYIAFSLTRGLYRR